MVADREYPVAHRDNVIDDRDRFLSLGDVAATKVHTAGRTELWLGLPGVCKIALRVDATNHLNFPVN